MPAPSGWPRPAPPPRGIPLLAGGGGEEGTGVWEGRFRAVNAASSWVPPSVPPQVSRLQPFEAGAPRSQVTCTVAGPRSLAAARLNPKGSEEARNFFCRAWEGFQEGVAFVLGFREWVREGKPPSPTQGEALIKKPVEREALNDIARC